MENFLYGPNKLTQASYTSFMFGVPKFSDDKKTVEAFGGFHTCREGLIHKVATCIETLNTDKTHIMFRWDSGQEGAVGKERKEKAIFENKKWLERSIKLLHLHEKLAGWPLTKTYEVKVEDDDGIKIYYFLSSRRWIKAPYLLSLYALIVRACKKDYFDDVKTYEDLEKLVKDIKKKGNSTTDEHFILATFPYWKTILRNYPDLFRKRKIEYYWSSERLNGNDGSSGPVGYEGITKLSNGNTLNTTLHKKVMELHNKG